MEDILLGDVSAQLNLGKVLHDMWKDTWRPDQLRVLTLPGPDTDLELDQGEGYHYKIANKKFSPRFTFSSVSSSKWFLDWAGFYEPEKKDACQSTISNCLARMIYGSNMIESASAGFDITQKLCLQIFEDIDELDEDYILIQKDHPDLSANPEAILRCYREIVQHANAAVFMIKELCLSHKELSEDIILATHRILTH